MGVGEVYKEEEGWCVTAWREELRGYVGMNGLLYVSACLLAGRGVKLLIYLHVLFLLHD